MKIKKWIAGVLAGSLLVLSLASVCFAAEADGQPPAGAVGAAETEAVWEAADAGIDSAPAAAGEEVSAVDAADNVTMGGTITLPFGSMEELEQAH